MKVYRLWLWLVPLTLIWPILHLFVFYIRFGDLPGNFMDFLMFLPMGLITGAVFLALWVRALRSQQKTSLILGYLLSSPIAFFGSLLSGLVYQPIVGTLLWGAGPQIVGMFIGVLIGYILLKFKPDRA